MAELLVAPYAPVPSHLPPATREGPCRCATYAPSELARSLAGGNTRVSPEILAKQVVVEGRWSALVPELLTYILWCMHASAKRWPRQHDMVACACVCHWWREATITLVRLPLE